MQDAFKILAQGASPYIDNNPQQYSSPANYDIVKSSPQNRATLEAQKIRSTNPVARHTHSQIAQGKLLEAVAQLPHYDAQVAEQFGKKLKRMYKFPASVNEAKVHQRAHRNGYNSSRSYRLINGQIQEEETMLCPCCQNFVNTVELPLCYGTYPKMEYTADRKNEHIQTVIRDKKLDRENIIQAFELQTGNALFFCFIKLVLTYLVLRFLILDAYSIYTNSFGHYCSQFEKTISLEKECVNHYFSILSTANKNTIQDQHYLQLYDILSLIFTLFSIAFFTYGRVKLYQLYELLQNWDISQDDYTVLIQDIPRIPFERNDTMTKDINQHYKDFIQKLISGKIRAWLNRFYSYSTKQDAENHLQEQFFDIFKDEEKKNLSGLFDQIVESVNLCYDLSQLENLESVREKLVQEFIEQEGDKQALQNSLFDDDIEGLDFEQKLSQNMADKRKGQQYISHIPHQIEIINRHFIRLCQRLSDESPLPSNLSAKFIQPMDGGLAVDNLKISRFVGKAFVSLKFQHYKHYLLGQFEENKDFLKINGNTARLRLSDAQKPNDIYWNNMKIEDSFRYKQVRNSYLMVLVILFISFIIIYKLRFLENTFTSTKTKKTIFQSIYLISLPVWTFLVGYVLDWGILQLNTAQRHKTKTEQLSSLVIKNVGAKFMNTSVIYAVLYFFSDKHVNLLSENGLVSILMSLVIINSLLNILFQTFPPYLLYTSWKNQKYDKMKKVNIFQIQLNRQLEYPAFDFANAYSYYLQMIFIISFYGYLVPLAVPLIIIAFIVQYWIDKYNLLKRYSSPVDMGYFLTDLIWKCFEATLILRPIGNYVWGYKIHSNATIISHICNFMALALSLAYFISVIFFSKKIDAVMEYFTSEIHLRKDSYARVQDSFEKTFESENPATSFLEKQSIKKKKNYLQDALLLHIFKLGEQRSRKEKFVPESEVVLENVWRDNQDRTIKYYIVEEPATRQRMNQQNGHIQKVLKPKIPKDFSTLFCW